MENESDDAIQPAEDELFGSASQSMEPDAATPIKRPFTAPKTDHVHDIYSDLIGPLIGSADGYELHFYDVNSYNYFQIKKTISVKDPVHFPSSLGGRKAGRNAIHYRWQTGTHWGEWFDSEWFYFLRTPIITVSDRTVHETAVPTITGVAEAGSHVQLARSGTHALLSNKFEVSAGGGFSFQTHTLTQGDYKAVVLNTQNGYHGVVLSAEHNFSVLLPPAIDSVDDGLHITPRPLIRGKGMVGATIDVYIKNTVTQVLKSVAVAADGTWAASSNHEFVASGSYTLVAYQTLRGVLSKEGPGHNFKFYVPPKILKPSPSTTQNASFLMEGHNGEPGAQLVVIEKSNPSITYGTTTVTAANGDWSIAVSGLPLRRIELVVKQFVGFSISISAALPLEIGIPAPVIGSPPSGSTQDTSFRIVGTGALPGATVEIFEDLLNNPALGSKEDSAATWYVNLEELAPGPLSLVAMQTLNGTSSPRSGARNFKIRPAELTTVTVEQADGATLVFSGNGHYNVKLRTEIQFTVPAAVSAPPNATVQPDGKWQTTATDWPFGEYDVEVIQKVSDNANGWIKSRPYRFSVEKNVPNVSDLDYTKDYQPTFTGKGFNGATVQVRERVSHVALARDTTVVRGEWTTRALAEWGPSWQRQVEVKQFVGAQESPNWVALDVTIPPKPPGLNDPEENGLSPKFSGTCWRDADVTLEFDDENQVHKGVVSNGTWQFTRAQPFAPDKEHKVTVKQSYAQQTSGSVSKTFTLSRPMQSPTITHPVTGSRVNRDVTIRGGDGMKNAVLQLRDKQFDRPLGIAKTLIADGDWSIDLQGLEFRNHGIDAQQTLQGRPSANSDEHKLEVVLLPPEIIQPQRDGTLERIAKINGKAMRGGRVTVFVQGFAAPVLSNVPVDNNGNWAGTVLLPVGRNTIWARQMFLDENDELQESDDSQAFDFRVVPDAPVIETPVVNDCVGTRVVVSGFGEPGDTVTVTLVGDQSSMPESTQVQLSRTWSVTLDAGGLTGKDYRLEAVASSGDFGSGKSVRDVQLATFLPVIDHPAGGQWVSPPVQFAGQGREGIGKVVSWYNPDVHWAEQLSVVEGLWCGESIALREAGNWCRFRQSLSSSDGATTSDWADSERFDVAPAPARDG
ncbi:hypothetical protein [Pseudomonas retamae]|uniref:Ig-like domain repeat protein n=1 Tax=Pseudomonas retamae TaxID=702110 RepID=A0ABW7DHT8_9PSED